jgi:hypothetical protein
MLRKLLANLAAINATAQLNEKEGALTCRTAAACHAAGAAGQYCCVLGLAGVQNLPQPQVVGRVVAQLQHR